MRLWLAAILTAGALTAPGEDLASRASTPLASGRQDDFAAAAREFGVPVSVLLGVAYLGSRWDAHGGWPSTAGGYGPMHLVDTIPVAASAIGDALGDARGDDARPMPRRPAAPPAGALRAASPPATLPEAGRLAGVEPARLRDDPAANIRAGAALLSSYQGRPSTDPADWYDAVARYSGADDPVAARQFADEVFAVMREGMERTTDDGHLVRLDPVPDLRPPHTDAENKSSGPAGFPGDGAEQADDGTRPPADAPADGGTRPPAYTPADGGALPGLDAPANAGMWSPTGGEPGTGGDPGATEGSDDGGSHLDGAEPRTGNQIGMGEGPGTGDQIGLGEEPGIGDQSGMGEEPGAGDGPDVGEESADGDPASAKEPLSQGGYAEPAGPPVQGAGQAECPSSLACEWMPAAYQRFGKKKNKDYGNHDRMIRPRDVDYIVIHDTEGTYQGIPSMIRNPKYVSWHYTIRSRDGHVAQHVATKDIAWHAGNWDVNTRSIGIEHEGYLAKGGTWYTEAMYRASAKLVRYLADEHGIPLNRAHILGHDNVPGTTPKTVPGMHEDPGPYWDWAHYFDLMKRPLRGVKDGDSVMIRPSYHANRPRFTGCETTRAGKRCSPHGAATVWLHTAPSESAPLVTDVGKHGNKPSSYSVYDHAARASTGQRFAVAARQGDWTAIWYLGQKAWFHNPASEPTAVPAEGPLVTPLRPGTKVYGRAYPEKSAYTRATYQPLTPLQYKIGPGQTYTVGDTITGSYYAADAFSPSKHVTTTGKTRYHQIQLGHRVMFVMAKDVRVIG
ncbi:N-acetylmuramoyl-L-alanine amidase [Nonomuraea sp. NPDC049480]|uniref:N-acetylmuramoyl-L-alanine amidase n=1 Tax=Nonomuraea sp. NPDC049480 TaxID=3364353 RepID=UPI003793B13E